MVTVTGTAVASLSASRIVKVIGQLAASWFEGSAVSRTNRSLTVSLGSNVYTEVEGVVNCRALQVTDTVKESDSKLVVT